MRTAMNTSTRVASGHTADWQPRPALRDAMQRIATIAVDDPSAIIKCTPLIADGARLQPVGAISGLHQLRQRGEEDDAARVALPGRAEPSRRNREAGAA